MTRLPHGAPPQIVPTNFLIGGFLSGVPHPVNIKPFINLHLDYIMLVKRISRRFVGI